MIKRFEIWSKIFTILVILIGCGGLLGLGFDIEFLKHPFPRAYTMNAIAAVAFIFSGIALILLTSKKTSFIKQAIGKLSAAIVFLIGFIKLISLFFGFDAQFDHILFEDKLEMAVPGDHINRLGANAAFCFMCAGSALLLLRFKISKKITPANYFTFTIWVGSLLSILGYTYNAGPLTGILNYISMAFYAAAGFMFLSLAIFLAYPAQGVIKELSSPFAGGTTARKFAFPAIAFPIVLGAFRIYITSHQLIPPQMESDVVILCIVIVFTIYIYNNAVSLNKKDMERKKTEEILFKNRELLQDLYDNAPGGYYSLDAEGKFINVNNTALQWLGYTKEELIGKPIADLLTIEGKELFNKSFPIFKKRGYVKDIEFIYKRKDGSEMNILLNGSVVKNESGEFLHSRSTIVDITKRKKLEEELYRSNVFLDTILENIPNMVFVKDAKDLRFVLINKAGEQIFNVSKNEMIGKNDYDFSSKERADYFTATDREVLSKGALLDIKEELFITKTGDIWLHTKKIPITDNNGLPLYLLGVSEDITEQKKIEAALKESNEKFLRLFYSSPLAMVIRNLEDGEILDANEEYERLFGFKKKEVLGKTCAELGIISDPEFDKQILSLIVQSKSLKNIEATLYNSKKEPIDVITSIETTRLGNKDCMISAILDITEIKRTQEELKVVNKELESFTYSVSHDLRAPLRIINGYAHMIEEEGGSALTEESRRMLENIILNAKQMGLLIDDLLNFSRLGRRELVTHDTDMNIIVKPIIEQQLNGNTNYTVIIHNLHPSYCDSNLIKQVWENLISNAVKYSANIAKPVIEIGSFEEFNSIVYYIKDNGAGFDMKYYDKLFGVFQRLHKASEFEGTGVGLALAQRIILKHGGKIWAESKINEGSAFYFTVAKS